MKSYLKYILGTALILSPVTYCFASDVDIEGIVEKKENNDVRKNLKKTSRVPDLAPELFDYNKYVATKKIMYNSMNSHNVIGQIKKEQKVLADYKSIIDDYEDLLMRFKNNGKCNVSLLEPYYKNPEEAWAKLTSEAYNAEKLVSASAIDDISKGKGSSINLARWNIGYKFLEKMYSNQSEYGDVRKPFPLWEDQKFFFNSAWNAKYETLAIALKSAGADDSLVETMRQGPVISDDVKYDKNSYEQVVRAHKTLVNTAFKGNIPQGVNTDPIFAPPSPLPPWKEIVYATDWKNTNATNVSVYPSLPAPWKEFLASGFSRFNSEGEMSKIVQVIDKPGDIAIIRMNTSVLPLNKNRIERYLMLRSAEEERRQVVAQVKLIMDKKQAELKSLVEEQGVILDKDIDFADSSDVTSVINLIKEQKETNLKLGQNGIKALENLYQTSRDKNMTKRLKQSIENLKMVAEALEADKESLIDIDTNNAKNAGSLLLQEDANQSLMEAYKKLSDKNKSELLSNQSSWCPIF